MFVNEKNSSTEFSNLTDSLHSQNCCLPAFLVLVKILLPFLLIGAVGNFLIVTFLISTSEKRTPMNLLILNQTLADLILSSLVYPAQVVDALTGIVPDRVTSMIFASLFMVCQGSVFISILFISLNRVLAIVYYRTCRVLIRRWFSVFGILLSWVAPLLFLIPVLVGWVPEVSIRPGSIYPMGTAVPTNQHSQQGYQRYFMSASIVCLMLPSIGTVICYVMVWKSAQRRRDRVGVDRLEGNLSAILAKRIQAAKLSGITAVCFFLTYYPFSISVIVRRGIVPASSNVGAVALLMILVFFLWIGCCINPVVFGLLNIRYRRWCMETAKKILARERLVEGRLADTLHSSNHSKTTGNGLIMRLFF